MPIVHSIYCKSKYCTAINTKLCYHSIYLPLEYNKFNIRGNICVMLLYTYEATLVTENIK